MLFENFRKFGGLSLGYTKLNTLERVPPPWQLLCRTCGALHLHLVSEAKVASYAGIVCLDCMGLCVCGLANLMGGPQV
jgi:hypothetical protein